MSEKIEGNVTLEQIEEEYKEAIDIFPSLHKYQNQHNTANLQKLCVEVLAFVRAIYASTHSEEERDILRKMLDKLKNL